MAKPDRPVATSQSTAAAVRRRQASRVRSAVRTQLAQSQRLRLELSHGLRALRRDLREFREHVRMRLRGTNHEPSTRKATTTPRVPPPPLVAASPKAPADGPPEVTLRESR